VKKVTGIKAPDLSLVEIDIIARRSPLEFLAAFEAMSRYPERKEVGFDHQALDWISQVWDRAALATVGKTHLRDACIRERDRYAKLCKDLKDGMHERQESGVVFLDLASDWPHPKVMRGAIRALKEIGLNTLH
jgi:hypothetical protein